MVAIHFNKKTRIVEYFSPSKIHGCDCFLYSKSQVPLNSKTTSVYETVETYEKLIFPRIQTQVIKVSKKRIPIRSLINIHDENGIKDIGQIKNFVPVIKSGGNIVKSDGLPNIKLARLRGNDFLVFDGHHSILAYMATGKIFIDEIPYIVVSGSRGYLKNVEILVFWGHHAARIPVKNWRNFVINWQDSQNQITIRTRRNMGELFDVIKEKIKS